MEEDKHAPALQSHHVQFTKRLDMNEWESIFILVAGSRKKKKSVRKIPNVYIDDPLSSSLHVFPFNSIAKYKASRQDLRPA